MSTLTDCLNEYNLIFDYCFINSNLIGICQFLLMSFMPLTGMKWKRCAQIVWVFAKLIRHFSHTCCCCLLWRTFDRGTCAHSKMKLKLIHCSLWSRREEQRRIFHHFDFFSEFLGPIDFPLDGMRSLCSGGIVSEFYQLLAYCFLFAIFRQIILNSITSIVWRQFIWIFTEKKAK